MTGMNLLNITEEVRFILVHCTLVSVSNIDGSMQD